MSATYKHPYCEYVRSITDEADVDRVYHNNHYGVPITNDDELFGRLILEINQAGLSWRTILLKEKNFRKAYNNFRIKKVAKYTQKDFERLMNDAGIIRNRLKIKAAITNAQTVLNIQKEYGSFGAWLTTQSKVCKNDKLAWVKLFKKHFAFVGGEIVGEFLMSIALLPGAHDRYCKRGKR